MFSERELAEQRRLKEHLLLPKCKYELRTKDAQGEVRCVTHWTEI